MLFKQVLFEPLFGGNAGRLRMVLVEDEPNFMGVETRYLDIQ